MQQNYLCFVAGDNYGMFSLPSTYSYC